MPMRDPDFLSELLQAIAGRGRRLFGSNGVGREGSTSQELADALLSTRGEASGVVLARAVLDRWTGLDAEGQRRWFAMLAEDFGPDLERLRRAVAAWSENPTHGNAVKIHEASEPRRQELFRRINMAPGGTAALVKMRERLLGELEQHAALEPVDADFCHLFGSWFNPGFLMLKRIDWSSPADVLEKIIRYEAVHAIRNWNDLRGRLQPADRRCFAFFHPRMPDEPLVFVEVALTRGIPNGIAGLIEEGRTPIPDDAADSAIFYSISNTQTGLKGISFGNFLIKQVVEELLRELPNLKTFATLSPLPGFARWLANCEERPEFADLRTALAVEGWDGDAELQTVLREPLDHAVAVYLLGARARNGKPHDAVARFHLNNGARLERINFCGDLSAKGLAQSHGVMVNYLYDLDAIEANHERYANSGEIASSAAIRKLAANPPSASVLRNLTSLLSDRQQKHSAPGS
ncbi:MAG: malonyl-CoA decarboxylase [Alphaproteobacteria bacterium]|nr:malonyl-CoA decarboxylase [Alphaproteobacteria bacterium]